MDTIAGCFAIQLEPTGTADPFALRRHALAIIRILEKTGWDLSIQTLIIQSLSLLHEEIAFDRDSVFNRVLAFFRERYRSMMSRSGYESDLIEAIISAEFDRITRLRYRMDHLKRFMTESSEFKSLVLTFKRISNILKNQTGSRAVNPELFKDPTEAGLWDAYEGLRDDVHGLMANKDYHGALTLLVRLRRPVDDLFDGVEILTKDNPEVRDNRIGFLQELARLFLALADFSKFSI